MLRTQLYADPGNLFLHDLILKSCRQHSTKVALVDSSNGRRLTYAEYGELVESLARGLVFAGLTPGEIVAIFLPNSWEFCVAYHAITLAGGVPTLLNPTYREREVRYQMENSGAVMLVTDGPNIEGIDLAGLPNLRRVYATRQVVPGTETFASLLKQAAGAVPKPQEPSKKALAALPYSSGTTGLPKGVMLSHYNLVANVYQFMGPNSVRLGGDDCVLCFLPLYHIYGRADPRRHTRTDAALSPATTIFPAGGGRRHHDADGAACDDRALPGGGSRTVSSQSQAGMGQMWRCAFAARTAAPFHQPHSHPRLPGLRHDRSLAAHPRRISRA